MVSECHIEPNDPPEQSKRLSLADPLTGLLAVELSFRGQD